jgi:hypothetical protein
VNHTYKPGYSGGRDQEESWFIVCKILAQKNPSQKGVDGVAQGVGPEFKPLYCQKKKKKSHHWGPNFQAMSLWETNHFQPKQFLCFGQALLLVD